MEDKEKNNQSMKEENATDQMIDQEERRDETPAAEEPAAEATGAAEKESQDLNKLREEVARLQKDNQELKDKYIRLYAEFDNYKKRTIREKVELMNTAARDTMTALLPVLDDFDRARKIAIDESTAESFSEVVRLVYNKVYRVLSQ